jgi:DNA-binding NarL/FixJ family response regulator
MAITVLVSSRETASSAALVRELRREDGIRVVGEARTGMETVAVTAALKPRVLLLAGSVAPRHLDVLIALVRRKSARTRVILLGGRGSRTALQAALAGGARGYLDATAAAALVSKAVRAVAGGESWLPRADVSPLLAHLRAAEATA